MKYPALAFLTTLVLAAPAVSFGISYSLSATFSGTAVDVNGSSHAYGFAGTFSAAFDDAGVPGSGFYVLTVAPQSVSFTNPTIGATTFDATNTGIDLIYSNGVLGSIALGGNTNQPGGVAGGTDDFALYFNPLGTSATLLYVTSAAPSEFALDFAPSVQFSLTATPTVPESTASLEYVAGVFALIALAHRRVKTSRAKT